MKVDLPVGKNIQDHVSVLTGPFTVRPGASFLLDRDVNLQEVLKYSSSRTGTLSDNALYGMGFYVSKEAKAAGEDSWPDIQFMLFAISIYNNAPEDFQRFHNIQSGKLQKYYQQVRGKDSFMIVTVLARPQSNGEILLAGTDPSLQPLINPNYFHEERDKKALVDGMLNFYVFTIMSFCSAHARRA